MTQPAPSPDPLALIGELATIIASMTGNPTVVGITAAAEALVVAAAAIIGKEAVQAVLAKEYAAADAVADAAENAKFPPKGP